MTNEQHASLLYAYVARLRTSDLEKLVTAAKAGDQAAMHYGNSAQVTAINEFYSVVETAVDNIRRGDLEKIEARVNEVS
jgi:hypothetical protein